MGRVVARELGARGATVHLVCRNQAKGDAAARDMQAAVQNPSARFMVHQVDLSRPAQVRKWAADFCAGQNRLDALVNNAGCMLERRELTPDNEEASFAVNVLGTYLLTENLLPVLSKTEGARVVTVTSAGMLTERLELHDPQGEHGKWDGTRAYAQHKRAQVELTHYWAGRHPTIQFLSVHPGWADTPAVQQAMPDFYERMTGKLRTPEQGADCILWATAAKAAMELHSGSFVEDRHTTQEHVLWAGTRTRPLEVEKLIRYLDNCSQQVTTTDQ